MNFNKVIPILVAMLTISSIGASAAAETTTNNTYNTSQISAKAVDVKNYVEKNYNLTPTVTINGTKINTTDYLYLLTQDLKNVNGENTSSIKYKKVSNPVSPTESLKAGTLTKTEYLSIANSILSFINTNGRAPSYATTSLGKIRYENLVYTYSKILSYFNTYKKLPDTVSVKTWYALTLGQPATVNITKPKTQTLLGKNSYGYVLKLGPFGNGTKKVAIIVGVHPEEQQTHVAMLNAISYLSSTLKNIQIWVYDVVVTKDVTDYTASRVNGQNLANKYVVPNIDTSFKLVVDTHGNRGNYYDSAGKLIKNSIFAPSKGATSISYANKIIAQTNGNLAYYDIESGTSPKYVTIPIANKGIPALVYEQYVNQANYAKVLFNNAIQVVKAINSIFAST